MVKQLEEVETKEIESIEIAGLDQGLTTKWYTYNFLSVDNQAVAQLREFIKAEVRNYMQDLGHEEGELYLQSWANLLKNKEILKTNIESVKNFVYSSELLKKVKKYL